jgi:hypothetical protein
VFGIVLGTQQAEEHVQQAGMHRLDDRSLARLARLAWKYEALPKLGDTGAMDTFVQASMAAYRFEPRPAN